MLSEYEQNLIMDMEGPVRKSRKWSLVKQPSSLFQGIFFHLWKIKVKVYLEIPVEAQNEQYGLRSFGFLHDKILAEMKGKGHTI